jgi:hypothetical protein
LRVATFEGIVEKGQIRLLGGVVLPDQTKVYVVVRDRAAQTLSLRSPRLAEPEEAGDFRMEITQRP